MIVVEAMNVELDVPVLLSHLYPIFRSLTLHRWRGRLAQQLRQLGKIRGDPPGLIFRQELGSRATGAILAQLSLI
jgi:hypothetical protein